MATPPGTLSPACCCPQGCWGAPVTPKFLLVVDVVRAAPGWVRSPGWRPVRSQAPPPPPAQEPGLLPRTGVPAPHASTESQGHASFPRGRSPRPLPASASTMPHSDRSYGADRRQGLCRLTGPGPPGGQRGAVTESQQARSEVTSGHLDGGRSSSARSHVPVSWAQAPQAQGRPFRWGGVRLCCAGPRVGEAAPLPPSPAAGWTRARARRCQGNGAAALPAQPNSSIFSLPATFR